MALASVLAVLDILLALLLLVAFGNVSVFYTASNFLFTEFAGMLIIGGCLMAREPLEDSKRYDDTGNPVKSLRAALMGRKLLVASLFVLVLSGLFGILGNYI
jgi:hypothetical protein